MIEIRRLTRREVDSLLDEAPDSETNALFNMCLFLNIDVYDFFDKYAYEHFGLIDNGRPIYLAALLREQGKFILWTVVNSNVKKQKSLYKLAKQQVYSVLPKYGEIYATMQNSWDKNIRWTRKMGFKECSITEQTITLKLSAEQLKDKPPESNKVEEQECTF